MKDQHEKIKGYRDLTQEEIDLMNEVKELEAKCGELFKKLQSVKDIDNRNLALYKTNAQQGFMYAVKAIARPQDNW